MSPPHRNLINFHRAFVASSECVPVASGRLAEGLGRGLSASIPALSIFDSCTWTGRMWVSCYELLVRHNPHGIARCNQLHKSHRSRFWKACRSALVKVCRSMSVV
ncbi:hypothetical protein F2Q69_00029123 [Brassica cretica]|uniref:Uncharacterized protein n=1 Tax=Brassica cretica TaxID=69181 RepID=A0A8S9S4D1_BRACR|nr:hypothetical protein F2Q69_00029123 [Brassica cretica]